MAAEQASSHWPGRGGSTLPSSPFDSEIGKAAMSKGPDPKDPVTAAGPEGAGAPPQPFHAARAAGAPGGGGAPPPAVGRGGGARALLLAGGGGPGGRAAADARPPAAE